MPLKRKVLLIILVVLAIIIVVTGCLFSYNVKNKQIFLNPYFVSEDSIIGVDISKYQGDVNMERLAEQGISFVYVKATEGSEAVDDKFQVNWENALESSLDAGAYHFFSFDSSGEAQACNFIHTVGDIKGGLIPAVDVEFYGDKEENPPDKEDVIKELGDYLQILEDTYHVKPMIYAQQDIYRKYLKDDFSEYPRWIRSVYYPAFFEAGNNWVVWQYCDQSLLDGYSGGEDFIDLNVINKKADLDTLRTEQ